MSWNSKRSSPFPFPIENLDNYKAALVDTKKELADLEAQIRIESERLKELQSKTDEASLATKMASDDAQRMIKANRAEASQVLLDAQAQQEALEQNQISFNQEKASWQSEKQSTAEELKSKYADVLKLEQSLIHDRGILSLQSQKISDEWLELKKEQDALYAKEEDYQSRVYALEIQISTLEAEKQTIAMKLEDVNLIMVQAKSLEEDATQKLADVMALEEDLAKREDEVSRKLSDISKKLKQNLDTLANINKSREEGEQKLVIIRQEQENLLATIKKYEALSKELEAKI